VAMKNFLIFLAVVAIIGVGVFLWPKQGNVPQVEASLPPASSQQPVVTRSVVPTVKPALTPPPSPQAGIKVREAAVHVVTIENFAFAPTPITVPKGDVVEFHNFDGVAHTIVADAGAFTSGPLLQGVTWQLQTANLSAGTYAYHCGIHLQMHGTIIVQ
jgi:plastocyanin